MLCRSSARMRTQGGACSRTRSAPAASSTLAVSPAVPRRATPRPGRSATKRSFGGVPPPATNQRACGLRTVCVSRPSSAVQSSALPRSTERIAPGPVCGASQAVDKKTKFFGLANPKAPAATTPANCVALEAAPRSKTGDKECEEEPIPNKRLVAVSDIFEKQGLSAGDGVCADFKDGCSASATCVVMDKGTCCSKKDSCASPSVCAAPSCTVGKCRKESADAGLASAAKAVAEKKEAAETAKKTIQKAVRVGARSHNIVAIMTLLLMSWWR